MKRVMIVGAGPAGIGVGLELINTRGVSEKNSIVILDKNDRIGGLSRTYSFHEHFFDIGPHRFYTRNKEVLVVWKKILGKDFKKVKRLTRIFYDNKLFLYPIELRDVFTKLGPYESFLCFASFLKEKGNTKKCANTFEEWVSQKFGKRLYRMFFKSYTEKVWGIPCNKIGAEWAEQRIKNIDFIEIIKGMFGKSSAKSLIHEFYYPTKGAGYMYQKAADLIQNKGGEIRLKSTVKKLQHKKKKIQYAFYEKDGKVFKQSVDYLFVSMPITEFIFSLSPKVPIKVLSAAKKLYYRDHITVNLLTKKSPFPDNWIYVHDPNVKMARVANYNNFTKTNRSESALSVEYFTFVNDELWKLSDEELLELAKEELVKTGLVNREDIEDGFVVREKDSYPTYYTGHQQAFDIVKAYVDTFTNVQPIGRGGLYKYNNMDHSLYSGMLAARNYILGEKKYNVWNLNSDSEYLEKK